MTPTAARLLRWLTELGDAGQPCPSNPVIAEHIGAEDASNMSKTLAMLDRLGLITLVPGVHRKVTITATGKTLGTARRIGKPRGPYNMRVYCELNRPLDNDAIFARVQADQARIYAPQHAWRAAELPGLGR